MVMAFPIFDLLDEGMSSRWLLKHFHQDDLKCPHCGKRVEEARPFRTTVKSRLTVYRCPCQGIYNLYSGTVFEGKHFRPTQVVLLLRGVCKGDSAASMARELNLSRQTVHDMRKLIQANAEHLQPEDALPDSCTESDEMFQNAGEKGDRHDDPDAPPRRRANKRRGHGTYANDRPAIVGTVGRDTHQVRLRVVHHTDRETLEEHVHRFTQADAVVNTDEWGGYQHLDRMHVTVCHGDKEWARDDDGDGIREVHTNTSEGWWTSVRNFLRPFRGVHKRLLSGYVAICEFSLNLKCVTSDFISTLVAKKLPLHSV